MRAFLLFACICIALATRGLAPDPAVAADTAATTGYVLPAIPDGWV
ncbi:hypothetical protein LA6_003900 [Marinibacterium anthonyi]|nr:hypothetical protein LA6_003900 [Marinibacterium anthonyi]